MFITIYGTPGRLLGKKTGMPSATTRDQLQLGLNRLYEELAELSEAIRLEHIYPIAVSSELADVFAWIMAVANVLPEHLKDPDFSLEQVVWSQYPGKCTYCQHPECSCPNDRVRSSLVTSAGGQLGKLVDELTGLPRKDNFQRELTDAVATATPYRPLSLIIVDLDRFKLVNDTWGHAFGDQVLRTAAGIVQEIASVSYSGTAYRWGGEEFTIILPNRTEDEARACAERIRTELRSTEIGTPDGRAYQQTASLGVGCMHGNPGGASGALTRQFFDDTDKALLKAKDSGRDQTVLADFSNPMAEKIPEDPTGGFHD